MFPLGKLFIHSLGKFKMTSCHFLVVALDQQLSFAHTKCGKGNKRNPVPGSRLISSLETPGGGQKVKICRRPVKNRKSSILAKLSPTQALLPGETKSAQCDKMYTQPLFCGLILELNLQMEWCDRDKPDAIVYVLQQPNCDVDCYQIPSRCAKTH